MPNPTVALPPERFAQLQRFAEARKTTMSEIIGQILAAAAHFGRIPDELPGWTIKLEGEEVAFAHAESGLSKRMPRAEAVSFGKTLRKAGNREERFGAFLDLDLMVEVRRRGNGVLLRDAFTHAERTVALNVADDLGRRLIRAAA